MKSLEKPFKIENCDCGVEHVCDVDAVVIEKGALSKLPALLKAYDKIILVSDNNTFKVCGEKVFDLLKKCGKAVKNVVFTGESELVPNEDAIERLDGELENDTQIVVGVGSGSINDLCKYVSFKRNMPCAIVATAPSMDGYASTISAMLLGGKKVSPITHAPKIIVADLDVLVNAPFEMIKSGAGDIMGKISCLNDWKISNIVTGERLCPVIYDMVNEEVESCIENIPLLAKRDADAVKRLTESLIIVGIAMSYMKISRPASGSEHHLSHFYEVIGLLEGSKYLPHGIDVGYCTVLTCKLRHMLLEKNPKGFKDEFNCEKWEEGVRKVYGTIGDSLIEFQKGLPFFTKNRFEKIVERWNNICQVLAESPTGEEAENMLKPMGFDMDEFEDVYGKEKIEISIVHAKEIKDKYSLLNLLQDIGLLNELAHEITT